MKARDRVKLCIEQARNHSGETALRAVINAVKILADQLKDELTEQPKPIPPHETHIGLIESNDGKTAICVDGGRFDGWILYKHADGQWVSQSKATPAEINEARELWANRITEPSVPPTPEPLLVERLKKAYIFAEMEAIAGGGDPVDMGVRAILTSLSTTPVAMMTADHVATLCGGEDYSPTDRRYARVAVQAFQEFIAPIVAAKDARITELESSHVDLQKSLARERELEKRIAELTTPMAVDRKTPGRVGFEGRTFAQIDAHELPVDKAVQWSLLDDDEQTFEEIGAQAVLRAFGNSPPGQTTQPNAADALRRVRKSFAGYQGECAAVVREAIDDELAKISAKPSSDPATPKLLATENELRGSYFCTEFPFRPYLHVGHDIEVDDIPRILKLGRNDIIEVRVVERAKP